MSDIAASVRALLHQRGLAGLVVLPDEDIKFVELSPRDEGVAAGSTLEADGGDVAPSVATQTDRVKSLGEFAYEISVRGVEDRPIRRTVRVVADDDEAAAAAEVHDQSANMEGSGVATP